MFMRTLQTVSILLFLLPIRLSGQISGNVTDKSDGSPIPYANIFVKGQDQGTTTDFNGLFKLSQVSSNTLLVISAIGYESIEVLSIERMNIELRQKVYNLPEVKVIPKKHKEKLTVIDPLRKTKPKSFVSPSGVYPWIVTKFFTYRPEYGSTSFINQIQVLTLCHLDSAIFNIRIFAPGPNGEPSVDLLDKNIIVTTNKGENISSIDLRDNYIIFPETGLFIAFEWLIVEQNFYQANSSSRSSIDPMVGILHDDNQNEVWMYSKGIWNKRNLYYNPSQTLAGQIAIQLTVAK
jgi:hypothetical protein